MNETDVRINPEIDKSTWGEGPWQHEPDRAEWEHAGLPCLALRNRSGAWCGYAAVPPGHPLHGKGYSDPVPELAAALERLKNRPYDHERDFTFSRGVAMLFGGEIDPRPDIVIDVHGGLTYANQCSGRICHVPKPGEPDNVWWFGFDCSHAGDISPAYDRSWRGESDDAYRTLDYVRAETNRLAEQLAEIAQVGSR